MMRLRREVRTFAEAMETKLRKNDHKGGRRDEDVLWLLSRLTEETRELRRAIGEGAPAESVTAEAADVANFAMMIADVCGDLPFRS